MIAGAHFTKLAAYNVWANQQIISMVKAAGDDCFNTSGSSSFNSIKLTAYHIYDAEYVWFLRLNNQKLAYWPPSRDFQYGIFDFADIWLQAGNHLLSFVTNSEPTEFDSVRSYSNSRGESMQSTVADMLTHCFNHSTYHRGQIIALLHQHGFHQLHSSDYITYCRHM